jgi:hypothetical protein
MKKLLLLSIVASFLASCQSDDSSAVNQTLDNPEAIEFESAFKHEYADYPEPGGYVFNDETAWADFAEDVNSPFTYDPETGITTNQLMALEIDFSTSTVIAVVDELHSHGGYDINVTSVTEEDNLINVMAEATLPNGGNVTAVLTQPYHIVIIPKTTLPVTFEVN